MYDETFIPIIQRIKSLDDDDDVPLGEDIDVTLAVGGFMVVEFLTLMVGEMKKKHPFLVETQIESSLERISFEKLDFLPFNVAAFHFRKKALRLRSRIPLLVKMDAVWYGLPDAEAQILRHVFGCNSDTPSTKLRAKSKSLSASGSFSFTASDVGFLPFLPSCPSFLPSFLPEALFRLRCKERRKEGRHTALALKVPFALSLIAYNSNSSKIPVKPFCYFWS